MAGSDCPIMHQRLFEVAEKVLEAIEVAQRGGASSPWPPDLTYYEGSPLYGICPEHIEQATTFLMRMGYVVVKP